MRVLLSAYACEDKKGSEPETGLKWAIEIYNLGHELTVITRRNNKTSILEFLNREGIDSKKLNFIYFDFPKFIIRLKNKKILPIYVYYFLWQIGAYLRVKKLHSKIPFDMTHHLTFCSIRHFSFLWLLDIPFIIGPMSGGDTSPFKLRWATGFKGGLIDSIRDIATKLIYFDPFFLISLLKAKEIAVTSSETLNFIPKSFRYKTKIFRSMGLSQIKRKKATEENIKNILFVGKFVYWKGAKFAILAFYKALKKDNSLRLTLIGRGPEEKYLKKLSKKLDIFEKVTWVKWISQDILINKYGDYGIFLFPSLHDSGGLVCLEAMASGLPLVCLDIGGPGRLVEKSFGIAVNPYENKYGKIINNLSEAILYYSLNVDNWNNASKEAIKKSKNHDWHNLVKNFNSYHT